MGGPCQCVEKNNNFLESNIGKSSHNLAQRNTKFTNYEDKILIN